MYIQINIKFLKVQCLLVFVELLKQDMGRQSRIVHFQTKQITCDVKENP